MFFCFFFFFLILSILTHSRGDERLLYVFGVGLLLFIAQQEFYNIWQQWGHIDSFSWFWNNTWDTFNTLNRDNNKNEIFITKNKMCYNGIGITKAIHMFVKSCNCNIRIKFTIYIQEMSYSYNYIFQKKIII